MGHIIKYSDNLVKGESENLDRVQEGEVAQMTEGDKNTTGNISFGSSFLPHLHPLRLKCSRQYIHPHV